MKTHKMTSTAFYKKRQGIKRRCYNKNDLSYRQYGGRGIVTSEKWLSFEGFFEDMFDSYNEHLNKYGSLETTIDRIDVNGNYCKENCRRATNKQQANNRRSSRFVTIDGETNTLQYFADKLNCGHKRIDRRLKSGKDIFSKDSYNKTYIEYNGERKSIADRAREIGLNIQTLGKRLRDGNMSLDEAMSGNNKKKKLFTRNGITMGITDRYKKQGISKSQFEWKYYSKKLSLEESLNLK